MKAYFQNLFAYERWANERILTALEQPRYPDERCLDLFSHILAAQQTWLNRVRREHGYVPLWERRDIGECRLMFFQLANQWEAYLAGAADGDFARPVAYRNTQGEGFETPLTDILAHLINHDTYHRGQIVEELRSRKLVPAMPVTDYIVFTREGK
jgi:uncharacterized damage-inducible protein DinB